MNSTSHEHLEDSEEHKAFREKALPLDNPKRYLQQEIDSFFPTVAGLASFRGGFQLGHTTTSDLEDFVPIEGTAFFYAYPQRGTGGTDPTQMEGWLVTAKHIIQKAFESPPN